MIVQIQQNLWTTITLMLKMNSVIPRTLRVGIGYVLNINNLIFSYFLLGGSVIRMLEHLLTHSVFRRGLSIYLNKQSVFNFWWCVLIYTELSFSAFSTAKPHDLYRALQEALHFENKEHLLRNLTVLDIMETWDSQSGYPIVSVKRNYQTGGITFSQVYSLNN